MIHKDLRINDWVEIRYAGETYLVSVSSLLAAYKRIAKLGADLLHQQQAHAGSIDSRDFTIKKLEAALREIRDITPPYKNEVWPHHHRYYYLAKQALGDDDE